MAKRFRHEVDLWVTFLWDTTGDMEPTDNRSERALRPAVIDRCRVQQNRSLRGVYRDMVLRSVAQTCRQLEVSFETVASEALLSRTRDGPAATPSPTLVAFQSARARARRTTTPPVVVAGL